MYVNELSLLKINRKIGLRIIMSRMFHFLSYAILFYFVIWKPKLNERSQIV